MFNDSKTEFLIIGSSQQLSKVTMASIKVGECDIEPLKHVTRKTFGDRAFLHAGPTVWNALIAI
ncbi:unnamed protein product [Porites lobata]|uniref:Uncharacterized protein n=1 Tax=Porites lobata TaxID=104759 RepID=A0ABN8P5L8_9CNID|nr:unnamed protein product [Porites lobata]